MADATIEVAVDATAETSAFAALAEAERQAAVATSELRTAAERLQTTYVGWGASLTSVVSQIKAVSAALEEQAAISRTLGARSIFGTQAELQQQLQTHLNVLRAENQAEQTAYAERSAAATLGLNKYYAERKQTHDRALAAENAAEREAYQQRVDDFAASLAAQSAFQQRIAPRMSVAEHEREQARIEAARIREAQEAMRGEAAAQAVVGYVPAGILKGEVEAAFGAVTTGATAATTATGSFNRELRHVVAGFDTLSRGQRGQFFSVLGAAMRDAGLSATTLGVAISGLVGFGLIEGLQRAAVHYGELAEKAEIGAVAAGTSAEEYQKFTGVMELLTGKTASAEQALSVLAEKLKQATTDPLSKAHADFVTLGFSAEQMADGMKHPLAALELIRQRFQEGSIDVGTMREAMGRAFVGLLPYIQAPTDELERLNATLEKTNSILDKDSRDAFKRAEQNAGAFNKSLEGLGESLTRLGESTGASQFATTFIQNITNAINSVSFLDQAISEFVQKHPILGGITAGILGSVPGADLLGIGPRTTAPQTQPTPPAFSATRSVMSLVEQYESGGRPYAGYSPPGQPPVDLSNAPLDLYGFPKWAGRMGPAGLSHAAGLFQFEPDEWRRYAQQLNIHDFSPESQRRVFAAAYQAEGLAPWRSNAALMAAISGGRSPIVNTSGETGGAAIGAGLPIPPLPQYPALTATTAAEFQPQAAGEMQRQLQSVREKAALDEAKIEEQASEARGKEDLASAAELEAQKVQIAKRAADQEVSIRQEYSEKAKAIGLKELGDKLAAGTQMQTREQQIQARANEATLQAHRQELQSYIETENQKTALTKRGSEERLAALQREIAMAQRLGLPMEAQRLQVQLAEQQRAATERSTQSLEREASAIQRRDSLLERQANIQARTLLIQHPEMQQQAAAIQLQAIIQAYTNEEAALQKVKDAAIAAGDAQKEKAQEVTDQMTAAYLNFQDKVLQVYEKIAQEAEQTAKRLTKPFTDAFDTIGSGMEGILADIAKISPVTTGIHRTSPFMRDVYGTINQLTSGLIKDTGELASRGITSLLPGAQGGEGLGAYLGRQVAGLFGIGQQTTLATAGIALNTAGTTLTAAGTELIAAATELSASAATQGASSIGSGFSGFLQGIPILGNLLGGGGAAATGGGAAATGGGLGSIFSDALSSAMSIFALEEGGIVPSAQGGFIAPGGLARGGQIAILHPREMVLPANISEGFQRMFAGAGNSGAQVNATYNTQINGRPFATRADMEDMVRSGGGVLEAHMRNRLRNLGIRF